MGSYSRCAMRVMTRILMRCQGSFAGSIEALGGAFGGAWWRGMKLLQLAGHTHTWRVCRCAELFHCPVLSLFWRWGLSAFSFIPGACHPLFAVSAADSTESEFGAAVWVWKPGRSRPVAVVVRSRPLSGTPGGYVVIDAFSSHSFKLVSARKAQTIRVTLSKITRSKRVTKSAEFVHCKFGNSW